MAQAILSNREAEVKAFFHQILPSGETRMRLRGEKGGGQGARASRSYCASESLEILSQGLSGVGPESAITHKLTLVTLAIHRLRVE